MKKNSWRDLPPEQRPAVGERVKVIRGKFQGYSGIVTGTVPKGVKIEVSQGALEGTITVQRHLLMDEDGNLMPEIVSEEEARRREEHQKLVKKRRIQARRIDRTLSEKGIDFENFLRNQLGYHYYEIREFMAGEAEIDEYLLADLEKTFDIGINWFLHGDEKCKEHPCGEKMKKYLDSHPEKRDIIWNWMQEDGFFNLDEDEVDSYNTYDEEDEDIEDEEMDYWY